MRLSHEASSTVESALRRCLSIDCRTRSSLCQHCRQSRSHVGQGPYSKNPRISEPRGKLDFSFLSACCLLCCLDRRPTSSLRRGGTIVVDELHNFTAVSMEPHELEGASCSYWRKPAGAHDQTPCMPPQRAFRYKPPRSVRASGFCA